MDSSKSAYLKCKYLGRLNCESYHLERGVFGRGFDEFLLWFRDYEGRYFDGMFSSDDVSPGNDETSKLLKIIVNGENPDGTINIIVPLNYDFGKPVNFQQRVRKENIIYKEDEN